MDCGTQEVNMDMFLGSSSIFQSPFLLDEGIEIGHFENCPPHHEIAPWHEPAMTKSSKPLLPMLVNTLSSQPMEFQSEASIANSILQLLGGHMESSPPCDNSLRESLGPGMATEMKALRLDKRLTEPLPLMTSHEGLNTIVARSRTNLSVADKSGKKPEAEPTRWSCPSGPRKNQEGTEDTIQGILTIKELSYDCCVVHVTLLVSGFLIGPKGTSVRDIQRKTGSTIRSQTQRTSNSSIRTIREFTIKGSKKAQRAAVDCMKAAVDRYKFLAEGACWGGRVSQIQVVNGVNFHYVPPPKEFVPYAASIAVDWGSGTSSKIKDHVAA